MTAMNKRVRKRRGSPACAIACVIAMTVCLAARASASDIENARMIVVPGGKFESVLPPSEGNKQVTVRSFKLDRAPVTNAQFAEFVRTHPEWQRQRIASVFADQNYLGHWPSPTQPIAASLNQPVTKISWFAAGAYCEARGARMPTWYEWEYVAAASETLRDARNDPAWRQRILDWYSTSARGALPNVAAAAPNMHGAHDLHGVVWEWVEDVGALLVSGDNRQQGDPDVMKFCGSGAITMDQKENYAILMRIAMLSSMQASYTS